LRAQVARLHLELQRTNSELERTLEENMRVRGYLARVVENLSCGVLVVSAGGALQIINPEARRLLEVPADWTPGSQSWLPPMFETAIAEVPENSYFCEQETVVRRRPVIVLSAFCEQTVTNRRMGEATPSGSCGM
jgi:nitrogen fixation/metabolism regulation signal transduction histidine kinase